MRGCNYRNLAPWFQLGWRDVLPRLTPIARQLNQAIIGAGPDGVDLFERRRHGINRAPVVAVLRIACRKRSEIRGHFIRLAGKIGTDNAPAVAPVRGLEQDIRRKVQGLGIERRKRNRERAVISILASAHHLWRDISYL